MVMYLGRPVEMGPKRTSTPGLCTLTPRPVVGDTRYPDPDKPKIKIVGELPNPLNPPPGCAFHKRCPYATERCSTEEPALRQLDNRRLATTPSSSSTARHKQTGDRH
jgi:dipeptide transport system ATP-binding protein